MVGTNMFSERRWIRFSISAMAALLAAAVASAQSVDAEISGMVLDPSGSPVARAKVSLTNQDSGLARSVQADSDGRYRITAIPPGRYSLKTEATGFRAETVTDIV